MVMKNSGMSKTIVFVVLIRRNSTVQLPELCQVFRHVGLMQFSDLLCFSDYF